MAFIHTKSQYRCVSNVFVNWLWAKILSQHKCSSNQYYVFNVFLACLRVKVFFLWRKLNVPHKKVTSELRHHRDSFGKFKLQCCWGRSKSNFNLFMLKGRCLEKKYVKCCGKTCGLQSCLLRNSRLSLCAPYHYKIFLLPKVIQSCCIFFFWFSRALRINQSINWPFIVVKLASV